MTVLRSVLLFVLAALAVFDAIAKVGELETMALCRYLCCGQAGLELVAAGAAPASC